MSHIYLSLGSNLGDRRQNLANAIESLRGLMTVTAVSPIYITSAWGPISDQPDFYNLCIAGTTEHSLECFLVALGHLEKRLGRRNHERWGPHSIDIDLLFMDNLVTSYGRKQIPHAGIEKRAFVLAPLMDIAPELVHPETNVPISRLYELVDKSCLLSVLDADEAALPMVEAVG